MKKTIILFTLVFILIIYFVNSLSTFYYNETDLISLQPEATDPDEQELKYSFEKPLDKNGEWQTTYGDAGNYKLKITVSDGELSTSEELLLVVSKKQEAPQIEDIKPPKEDVELKEGERLEFKVIAIDLNKDLLSYSWYIDDDKVADENSILFSPGFGDVGEYIVKVIISDGKNEVSNEWKVKVNDAGIKKMLDDIEDIEVTETEIVKIDLPNLRKYGMSVRISEPIGGDNYWLTDYESAGEYIVSVTAELEDYSEISEIKVTVLNKDRPPRINMKPVYFIKEDETLVVDLNATDPDGDEIIFSSDNYPENAQLLNDQFVWKPSFDTIIKDGIYDYIADKFHLLFETFSVSIIAETENDQVRKDIRIIVQDNNRPFVIEEFETIVVNEGDLIKIEPAWFDPDNDTVRFTYSGWMNKNIMKTTFGDAGEYYVKVTGSDGFFKAHRFVKIIVKKTNRIPLFEVINNVIVKEDEEISVDLIASDPDNDDIDFKGLNIPNNAKIRGNKFIWKPDYDIANQGELRKKVPISIEASDGKSSSTQNFTISVVNVNRPPKIIETSDPEDAQIKEPYLLWINAEDPEGDELTYDWSFGLLEKYSATASHERIFSKKGTKNIRVTVSDGLEFVDHEWEIKVK